MNKILLIIAFCILAGSCEKQEIRFLDTENAAFIPDRVVFKAKLNPDNPKDADIIKFKKPFQSPTIQKVLGTPIVSYSIHHIDCNNDAFEALGQFYMKGKRVEWSYDHSIPPGEYVFSIDVSNEWHRHTLDSVLTIVLE